LQTEGARNRDKRLIPGWLHEKSMARQLLIRECHLETNYHFGSVPGLKGS
jgi:hypothetical protein